ncbi:MAG: hypothetical protein H6613_15220 [Ignavibacteriales bacterium]|nr:hypothetical protein [Ignavibacteriales bacterium]
MDPDTFALVFIIVFVIILLIGIIYAIVSKNMRGGGGSSFNSVTFFGATSQFQNVEQKAAMEHILEEQAGKKMEEQETGEPKKNNLKKNA